MIPVISHIVEVCAFRFVRSRAEYLVLQRAAGERLHPGMWQIITGEVDGTERAVDAALRELREETGCAPIHLWAVPETTIFFDAVRNEVNLCPVFGVQVAPDACVQLSGEHQNFEWLVKPDALKRLVWPSHRATVQMVDEYIVSGQEAALRLSVPLP